MSTQPPNTTDQASTSETTPHQQRASMAWLLREFVSKVRDVTHAVLLSRDGLRLLDSDVDKDWADRLAAAISGLVSLAANLEGPAGQRQPAGQIIIERGDCLFFVQGVGHSTAFNTHDGRRSVDTILAVVTGADADAGTVGYEMGQLVQRFRPHMLIPVRVGTGGEDR